MQLKQFRRYLGEILADADRQLAQGAADTLIAYSLNIDQAQLLAHEGLLDADQLAQINRLAKQYLEGMPLDYIVQKSEFMGLSFKVTPAVLIPRADTECLVKWLLDHLRHKQSKDQQRLLELGVGSGCIAISLLVHCVDQRLHITGTDISRQALDIALENSQGLGVNRGLQLVQSDWFEGISENSLFDIIISNPPYIDACADDYDPNQLAYEPRQALFSNQQGMADLKHIIQQAPGFLKKGGLLIVEHGFNQAKIVRKLLEGGGFEKLQSFQDLARRDRFSVGFMRQ